MRDEFPEYYGPDQSEVVALYREADIILDANILLGLYRRDTAQREEIFDVLERVHDRLWVPHQAAREYQENRLNTIKIVTSFLRRLRKTISDAYEEGVNQVRAQSSLRDFKESLESLLQKSAEEADTAIDRLAKQYGLPPATLTSDDLRDRLDALLHGRVGSAPSDEVLARRLDEARRRADAGIPPGYADRAKSGDHGYGDYLLWAEVLERAGGRDVPVIFVTDDSKEDWWIIVEGLCLGPRIELVREFTAVCERRYHQVRLDTFLRQARTALNIPVSEETLRDSSRVYWQWMTATQSPVQAKDPTSAHYDSVVERMPWPWLEHGPGQSADSPDSPASPQDGEA